MKELHQCTLLIVDDALPNTLLLNKALEKEYQTQVAHDGPSALDSVFHHPPDLILLDVMMPGMSGFEVCRRIMSDPEINDIPIIFITAAGSPEEKSKGFAMGAVDYITKPFDLPEVKARVKTHLSLRIARQSLRDQNILLESKVRERTRELENYAEKIRMQADALQIAEEKYRTIFENAVEGIYQSTPQGNFLSANPALAVILGYDSAEELIGTTHDIEKQIYVDKQARKELQQLLTEKKQVTDLVTQFYKKNGDKIWVSISTRAVDDEQGRIAYYEGFVLDITQRKQAQMDMFRAMKLAALGELLAGIAHEINNPNNFIYFNLPVLKDYIKAIRQLTDERIVDKNQVAILDMPYDLFFEDLLELIEDMQLGSERINGIVAEIKTYIHNQAEDAKKPEAMAGVIERVMKLMRQQVQKKVKHFDIRVADDLPLVFIDSAKIEQVVINLLLNAVQAIDHKNGRVSLQVRPHPENPVQTVVIEVEDNGAGIPEDVAESIFDPFFTTKGRNSGTGLGLSISQRIVEEHGGKIAFESLPGKGTRFRVGIPAFTGEGS